MQGALAVVTVAGAFTAGEFLGYPVKVGVATTGLAASAPCGTGRVGGVGGDGSLIVFTALVAEVDPAWWVAVTVQGVVAGHGCRQV